MLGAVIRQFVLLAPFIWLFTRLFGVGATWFALWISESAAFALSLFLARREIKKKVDPLNENGEEENHENHRFQQQA